MNRIYLWSAGLVGLVAGATTLACDYHYNRMRRSHMERLAQYEQQKKDDEIKYQQYRREYEKEMLDIYGENWRDHEVKGIWAIVAGYPESVRRRDAALKREREAKARET